MLAVSFFYVLGCDNAKTIEYYDTHVQDRAVKIEQCKKMNPADVQNIKDCQAAKRSWSIAENKRFFETDKKRENPLNRPAQK